MNPFASVFSLELTYTELSKDISIINRDESES